MIFSTADWDHPSWTNKQHVAACLADMGHRVLYIESLGMRCPSATTRDMGRICKRFKKLFADVRCARKNIWVLSPFSIPFQNNYIVRAFNFWILRWKIRKYLCKLNMKKPFFWTYNPLIGELLDKKYWGKSIYHCVDEISEQPGMPARLIQQKEKELLSKVDYVFVTSIRLYEEKRDYNSATYYFPNAVDFDHFYQAITKEKVKLPEELEAIPEPRIGFVGAISSYKLDFELLYQIACLRPTYNFILIGDIGEGDPHTDVGKLKELNNVFFLGHRPYQQLPDYLRGFQVCLLPFKLNKYTEYMFPMKFFEYLAAGRPTVGIELPSLKKYKENYVVASTPEEFIAGIDQCIISPDLCERLKVSGIELAKNNTYRQRTQAMLDIIVGISNE